MNTVVDAGFLDRTKGILAATLRLPPGKMEADAELESFGMDSIIAIELITKLQDAFHVSISPAEFSNVATVRDLAMLLQRLMEKPLPKADTRPVAPAEKPAEKALPENAAETNQTRIVRAMSHLSRKTSQRLSFQSLLRFIKEKYSIDLGNRSFASLDEIVETLMENHAGEILLHYDSREEPGMEPAAESPEEIGIGGKARPAMAADVAIVGISCNFPDAPNPRAYWENLVGRKNSIREIPADRWNWEQCYSSTPSVDKTISKWGALIPDVDRFDAGFFGMTPEEVRLQDPQERLLIQEVYRALQDGGIDPAKLRGSDTGIFVAYEYSEYEHYLRKNKHRIPTGKTGPFFSSSSPTYIMANRLSLLFDFRGPSESINVNCAGSGVALNRAYYSLLNLESGLAVVGGVSLNLFADDYVTLSQYGLLSPDGTCGVFDDNANGFCRGEGVASIVLKRLADAERDNDRIYGIIKSSHESNRGHARFISEVKHEAFAKVIRECYAKAGISPDSVSYIEVDGYATKWGDSFEFDGIKSAFKDDRTNRKHCALGSVKGNIGNLESVNGLAGIIKLALSLQHKSFPATISKRKINSFLDVDNPSHPLYIADTDLPFESIRRGKDLPIRAGINSFADTGVNVHVLLEEYLPRERLPETGDAGHPQLFVLSAKDSAGLEASIEDHIGFFEGIGNGESFAGIAYTSQAGREAMDHRLAIVATSPVELIDKLKRVRKAGLDKLPALEKQSIFHGHTGEKRDNPLKNLLTGDMAAALIEQLLRDAKWEQIAPLWTNGVAIPWARAWQGKAIRPVTLPTYPFAKERFWMDFGDEGSPSTDAEKVPAPESKGEAAEGPAMNRMADPEWIFFRSDRDAGEFRSMDAGEKIGLFLKQEIALLLGQPMAQIDSGRNFIELGLNSLGIGTFASKLNDLLQINMSPGILFSNPEIDSLARYVASAYPENIGRIAVAEAKQAGPAMQALASQSAQAAHPEPARLDQPLVPMQTGGARRPIFAVTAGGLGTSLALQSLAQDLGPDQPVYALEAVGLDGDIPRVGSIEAIAEANLAALRKVRKDGPYRLLGISNGGIIAFEMARQLQKRGEAAESLILLDCLSPLVPPKDLLDDIVSVFKGKFANPEGGTLELDAQRLREIPEGRRFDFLYETISKGGFSIPKHQFAITYHTAVALERHCRAYKPSKLMRQVDATLFRATEGYMEGYGALPEDYGWNRLLSNKVRIIPVKANHFTIADAEHSSEVAKTIHLLAADARNGKATGSKKAPKREFAVKVSA